MDMIRCNARQHCATTSLDYLARSPIETMLHLTSAVLVQAYHLVPDETHYDSDFHASDRHIDTFVALLVAMNILPRSEEKRTAAALNLALHWLTYAPDQDAAEHFVSVAFPDGLDERPAPRELISLYVPQQSSRAARIQTPAAAMVVPS